LVVEWEVVHEAPDDEAVEGGAEEGEQAGAVVEAGKGDEGVFGEAVLEEEEDGEAGGAEAEGEEGVQVGPGVDGGGLHDGDEDGDEGGGEDGEAGVVDGEEGGFPV